MTASGPNACPSLTCATKTLNRPIPRPAINAKRRPDGPLDASLTRETSTTATIASTIPTSVSADGTPSSTIPATTGISAAMHAGHRRHDAHPPDGEAVVERGDADRRPTRRTATLQNRSTGSGAVSPRTRRRTERQRHADELARPGRR